MRDVLSKAAQIQLIVSDMDGVLTDGRLYLSNTGNEFNVFHVRDTYSIKMLLDAMTQAGLAMAVQDTDPFVRQYAHWQTPDRGRHGAARGVCELALEARGQLESGWSCYL